MCLAVVKLFGDGGQPAQRHHRSEPTSDNIELFKLLSRRDVRFCSNGQFKRMPHGRILFKRTVQVPATRSAFLEEFQPVFVSYMSVVLFLYIIYIRSFETILMLLLLPPASRATHLQILSLPCRIQK